MIMKSAKTTVAIIGVGLIGGSLGLALKKRKPCKYRVIGIGRHPQKLSQAKKCGAIDEVFTDISSGVREADIVVVCSPVDTIGAIVGTIAPFIKPGAVITDVGSVKGNVTKEALAALPKALRKIFVGAHPMAGAEKSGIAAADCSLFCNSSVVIDPANKTAAAVVAALWKDAGAIPVWLSPRTHDTIVAVTSHLPHILAYALCAQASKLDHDGEVSRIISGSFKDLTRVADSDPDAWATICSSNAKQIALAIDNMITALKKNKTLLFSKTSHKKLLTHGHLCRSKLLKGTR